MNSITPFRFSRNGRALRAAVALAVLAGFCLDCYAVGLSVTPNSLSNSYPGNLTLQITGLTNGETVRIERFLDANANGLVDPGEPLVGSFTLTDGQVISFSGVRNGNLPGDNDLAVNGQITATLSFQNNAEFSRGSGNQIFRLSSPTGNWAPVQQSITVTQAVSPYHITGQVLNGSTPVANALVGLLMPIGTDLAFITGATADASGNFSVGATNNGTYYVLGFAPGYLGNLPASPFTVSGADVSANVALTAGTFTVSGQVADTSSGLGIPGLQYFVTSTNNQYAACFSDAQGNFTNTLVNGKWKFDTSNLGLAASGYLRPQTKPKVTVNGANVTGQSFTLAKGTALIYGTVKDGLGNPLAGVILSGSDNLGFYNSEGVTDASGQYFLAASAAIWNVGANSPVSGLPNGYVLQSAQVTVSAGQAVQQNLVASQASAYLAGHATDNLGHALTSGSMLGFGPNGTLVTAQLASDASFVVPVSGGSWMIALESQTASSWNVVPPQLSFNVTDGVSISNINYVAPAITRTISGSVKTGSNLGVSGVNVFANALINGTNYNPNATTDANGNFSLGVIPAIWNVGVDQQGLAQLGYGPALSETADTSSGSQVVNFLVGTATTNTMFFRHNLGVVGDFLDAKTPTVTFPVAIKNYRAIFHAYNEPNPPSFTTVFFTGPPGSGLTNTPADPNFGVVQNGTDVSYSSPPVKNPPIAPGGGWTVVFRTNANNLQMPDPQATAHTTVQLPTISLSNGVLQGVNWVYKDQNGNPFAGIPGFVQNTRIDLIDQNGNLFDAQVFPAAMTFTYPAASLYPWSSVGALRMNYYDILGNQFFVTFTESAPTLTGPMSIQGTQFQFQLSGPPLQNFTIQYSTNLGVSSWNTLYVTNSAVSPITILDPHATNAFRWYRVLLGP